MRRIRTQGQANKEERRNKIIVGIVLVFLMLFSVIGYAFFSRGGTEEEEGITKINYNGIEFTRENEGLWRSEIDNHVFWTAYNPRETSNISLNIYSSIGEFYDKPLFVISDNSLATDELIRNIGEFTKRYQAACLEGETCEGNLPVKNCTENIIIMRQSNLTNIYRNESCIFLEAPYREQVRVSDALIFRILGI